MKVTQKHIDESGVVTLSVTANSQEVDKALDAAQLGFARQMGVRPKHGTPIAQSVKEQLGITNLDSVVREQAIERLIPLALDKATVMPAFPPKVSVAGDLKRGREFRFELPITPKPRYELTSYDPVEITVQPMGSNDPAVEEELKKLKERYVEFKTADPRPLEKGDSCLIKVESSKDGEPLTGLTFDSRPYTTGAGYMPEGFDQALIGMNVGETKSFSFEGPDFDKDGNQTTMKVDCTVTVLERQVEVEPELTDEWVSKNMPMYPSFQALRDDITAHIDRQRSESYENYKRDMATAELAKRFQGSISDEAYEAMAKSLVDTLRMQVQTGSDMTFDQFVEQQGGQQQFNMMVMLQARQMLTQGYALDAVYRHEHLEATDEDLDDACKEINPQNPRLARERMTEQGRGFALREQAERIRASKWVLEHAKVNLSEAAAPAPETAL
ncbi:MAG: trigger factor [Coriobacteriales bacterium]|nr:trigger factor [Coriobacteriales bacterium]